MRALPKEVSMRQVTVFLLVAGALTLAGCGGGKSNPPTTTQVAGPVTINVQIKGGKPVGGIQRATAKKGDKVSLIVKSDVADEVHIHGYNLIADVVAGGAVRITFKAGIAGVFEAELENRGLQIAELTVK
jgi:hypothetical protein